MEKNLYYKLEADDYNVIMDLSGCFEWIKTSVEDLKTESDGEDTQYIITPVWMTEEEFNNLPEAD